MKSPISKVLLLCPNESKMTFAQTNPKPSDRSIFRKNIGRALLNKQGDSDYLWVWEIDYTSHKNRTSCSHLRNVDKEKDLELQITSLLRKTFYFRLISLAGQEKRMGKTGMESRLIGTVANCMLCSPSKNWLGKYSPAPEINSRKLWLSQHLNSVGITDNDKTYLLEAVAESQIHL